MFILHGEGVRSTAHSSGFFPSVVLSFWEHDSQSETRPEHKRVLLRWVCRLYHSATQLEHYPRSVVMVLQASTDPSRTSMACILLSLAFMKPPETVWSAWHSHMFAIHACPAGKKNNAASAAGATCGDPPPQPAPGYVWVPDYWTWSNNGWAWIPGKWERLPDHTATWVPGQWMDLGDRWVWHAGHWE